ncbi:MAG: T9SS type A sorting domain-containing protein, partial [Muribaculaceae bacterium]|nr:T9SS type A sorting domain-containing protein [Muribaculaceae bacterium]
EGRLTVGGITDANTVSLINTAGITVVTATVSPSGTAVINTGALGRGVYLLNVNTTTLKIIL